jgi:predicted MFS family arabinose efflux permease
MTVVHGVRGVSAIIGAIAINTLPPSANWRHTLKADLPHLAACGTLCMAGYASYGVLAVLLPILMTATGIDETNLGNLASADLTGILVGSLCLSRIARPGNSRAIGAAAIAVGLFTNLLTPWLHSIPALILTRLLAGIAAGVCLSLAIGGLARFGNVSFNTSIYSAFSIVGISIELLLFSYVEHIGAGAVGCYLVIVLFFVLAGLSLKWYPEMTVTPEVTERVSGGVQRAKKSRTPFAILLSILLYGIGMSCFFAYAGILGRKQGISDQALTPIFNVCNILGLIGSWISFKVDDRFGPVLPQIVSLMVFAVVLGVVPMKDSPITYAVLVMVFIQLTTLVQNSQIEVLIQYDPSGRTAALVPTALGVGLAVGPLLGSFVLAEFQSYRVQLVMESICMLAAGSIVALVFLGRNFRAASVAAHSNRDAT